MFHARFVQCLFERRIAWQHRDIKIRQCFDLRGISLDHYKCSVYGAKAANQVRSDASRAASVPIWPIATPICAARNAGASLTPSPVTATKWPWRCSD